MGEERAGDRARIDQRVDRVQGDPMIRELRWTKLRRPARNKSAEQALLIKFQAQLAPRIRKHSKAESPG